jgi:hypothetical protein
LHKCFLEILDFEKSWNFSVHEFKLHHFFKPHIIARTDENYRKYNEMFPSISQHIENESKSASHSAEAQTKIISAQNGFSRECVRIDTNRVN